MKIMDVWFQFYNGKPNAWLDRPAEGFVKCTLLAGERPLNISDSAKCEECSTRALAPRWPLMYVHVTGHKTFNYDFRCACGRGIYGEPSEHELVKAWNERMEAESKLRLLKKGAS